MGELAGLNVPLPPLHVPVEGVVVTCNGAVELLQIVSAVVALAVPGVLIVTVA